MSSLILPPERIPILLIPGPFKLLLTHIKEMLVIRTGYEHLKNSTQ
jgi:hypothetical protein